MGYPQHGVLDCQLAAGAASARLEGSAMVSKRLMSRAPFEIVEPAPGISAAETWRQLRGRRDVTPVFLGDRYSVENLLQQLDGNRGSPEDIARQALRLDVDAWIADQVRARPGCYRIADVDVPWDGVDRRRSGFQLACDPRGPPYPEGFFGLIPVQEPWLVPAYLKWSAGNNCPEPAVNAAFFRRWLERYAVLCAPRVRSASPSCPARVRCAPTPARSFSGRRPDGGALRTHPGCAPHPPVRCPHPLSFCTRVRTAPGTPHPHARSREHPRAGRERA
jgi:hypothetical protein